MATIALRHSSSRHAPHRIKQLAYTARILFSNLHSQATQEKSMQKWPAQMAAVEQAKSSLLHHAQYQQPQKHQAMRNLILVANTNLILGTILWVIPIQRAIIKRITAVEQWSPEAHATAISALQAIKCQQKTTGR